MTRPYVRAALLTCCALSPAQASPSFDCEKAGSSAEELICADAELAALDVRMSERFAQTLAAIDTLDTGKEEALSTTRAMQRGWIKGRDDCWKAPELRACVKDAYLLREGELVAEWMLDPPSAVVAYACDGNPANEVTVFYFETERPSVRLEYGDSVRTGSQVPSASGARYETPFGGMFWAKGETARFAWTEGSEMSCVATD